jgi:hypothetical protein
MSGLNGVHALLAFLTHQAQSARQTDGSKLDVKQLESLLQESRILNERLLKIEQLLSVSKSKDQMSPGPNTNIVPSNEGNWPAASNVRDVINRQERQQAFGNWQSETTSSVEAEPFSYREVNSETQQLNIDAKQLLIERYMPTEAEQENAKPGLNFGIQRHLFDNLGTDAIEQGGDGGRLLILGVGFSLLLFALFSMF